MPDDIRPRRSFGSLFRKQNGKWLARYPDPSGRMFANGRVRVVNRTLPSKRAGERFLREMERAIAAAVPMDDEPEEETTLTLIEAIDEYLETRGKRLSPLSLGGYKSSRMAVAQHPIADIPITALRPTDIDDYLDWRKGIFLVAMRVRNGKPKTVVRRNGGITKAGTLNRDHTVIQASLSEQVRREQLARNPAALVRRRKMQQSPRQAFQASELQRFIAACEEDFLPLVLAAVFTGARIGELRRLVWSDIYFETSQIMLRRSKTGCASAIPMHPDLARHLAELRKRRSSEGRIVRSDEPVFLTPKGKVYGEVRAPWRRAMKAAGLGDRTGLTFHSLRHTFATRFLAGGAAVTDLQGILGHRNLTTTQIYAHMVDARARASVEALDFGLRGVLDRDNERCRSIG